MEKAAAKGNFKLGQERKCESQSIFIRKIILYFYTIPVSIITSPFAQGGIEYEPVVHQRYFKVKIQAV